MTQASDNYIIYGTVADVKNTGVPMKAPSYGTMLMVFLRLVQETDFRFTKELKLVREVKVNGSNVTRVVARAKSRTEADFLLERESWR